MAFKPIFAGISAKIDDELGSEVAFCFRDAVQLIDFHTTKLDFTQADSLTGSITKYLESYEYGHNAKIVAAGFPSSLGSFCARLCSRLWLDHDIIPFVMPAENWTGTVWGEKGVDEQADSMARRCIMCFNPSMTPALQIGWHSAVDVDAGGMIRLCSMEDYQRTCSRAAWETMIFYASKLRDADTKIAFFSATPQGGGVAIMRHALMRLSRLMKVKVKWYVPKPRQAVFRITKNIHNILQGVARPHENVLEADKSAIIQWITDNAERYWLSRGGPLCRPDQGGADIVIIDGPQMIGLIPLSRKVSPNRPVLFRSHIQIRSDLIASGQQPQRHVWDFVWSFVRHADAFLSHPIPAFVPQNVPQDDVAYLPATTDWLDGLNKPLRTRDIQYYKWRFDAECRSHQIGELEWPDRKYIVQVSRFDPAKGIRTVIDSYAEFRRQFDTTCPSKPPQLLICGNPSIDDPDGAIVFEDAVAYLEAHHGHLKHDVILMRLSPNDQILNMLIRNAHVVLQLSTAEGFEVKVSEALRAGRPVIGTSVGGIPLQITHAKNGYLVRAGDWKAVAGRLMNLFTNHALYTRLSTAAAEAVTPGDGYSTVGNAVAWYFLACKFVLDGGIKGNGRQVYKLAMEEKGRG